MAPTMQLPDLRSKLKHEEWDIHPRHGFVIITPLETGSEILLPESAKGSDKSLFRVVAVGPGHWGSDGKRLETGLKVGDIICPGSTHGNVGLMALPQFDGALFMVSDESIALVLKQKLRGIKA